jgi:TatD DNase family protein
MLMKLFDTHFHYCGEVSPDEYFSSVKTPELAWLLAAGAGFDESKKAQLFAERIKCAWFAAGAHPHSASGYVHDITMFEEFKGHPKLAAVGELGLDFYYENSEKKIQYAVFEKFLALALDWKLPAIVHCRDKDDKFDAYAECYELLKDFSRSGGRFVVHCFAGTPAWAEKFLELGAFVGIAGIATFPKAVNIHENIRVIPNDRMLIETDSPYLAPVPYRGKINNPGYLIKIAEKIALLRGCPVEDIADITTANAFNFFNIKETAENEILSGKSIGM